MNSEAIVGALPTPFVGVNVDLRDFPYMPVDISRLFGSEFHAISGDCTWRAGVTLWLKSYHQVPAASLPDDDIALARLAELGRDLKTWRKVKAAALRGWIKCSDGRLYHKVVAEKALEAWIEKTAQRKVSAAGNAKRYKMDFDPISYDQDLDRARAALASLNPQSRMLARKGGKYAAGSPFPPPSGRPDDPSEPPGERPDDPESPPDGSADDPVKSPKERKGKGREGNEITKDRYLSPAGGATDDALEVLFESYPGGRRDEDGVRRELGRRLTEGIELDDIVAGAKRYRLECAGRGSEHISSPVKWLVDGRWKNGAAKSAKPAVVVSNRTFVGRLDPNWRQLSDRWRTDTGRAINGNGWYFPNDWIAACKADSRVSA